MLDFIISLITFPVELLQWVLGNIFTGVCDLFTVAFNIGSIICMGFLAKVVLTAEYRMEERRARREMRKPRHTWH